MMKTFLLVMVFCLSLSCVAVHAQDIQTKRDECLNAEWFHSPTHARVLIKQWRREYNEEDRTAVWPCRRRESLPRP
jgi:Integrase core domain